MSVGTFRTCVSGGARKNESGSGASSANHLRPNVLQDFVGVDTKGQLTVLDAELPFEGGRLFNR